MTVIQDKSFAFMQKTQSEAQLLLDVARDYFMESGEKDRQLMSPEAKLAYALVMCHITLKLSASLHWLQSVRMANQPDQALEVFDGTVLEDEHYYGYLPKMVQKLADASTRLYKRVQRMETTKGSATPVCNIYFADNVLKFRKAS